MGKDFIVDLVGKVTDEDMEVVSSVFLARLVGLICPVDTNFLILFVRRIFTIGGVGGHTAWWILLPFKVAMARSAAPGSSYSMKP